MNDFVKPNQARDMPKKLKEEEEVYVADEQKKYQEFVDTVGQEVSGLLSDWKPSETVFNEYVATILRAATNCTVLKKRLFFNGKTYIPC